MPKTQHLKWWAVYNNQVTVNAQVEQAASRDEAIRKYFDAAGAGGSRTKTAVKGPFNTQAEALKAAESFTGGGPSQTVGGAATQRAPQNVNKFLTGLSSRDLVVRIVEVILGGALIVVGVTVLAGDSKLGKTLRKTTPIGKIL
jgi:hypothetical protein